MRSALDASDYSTDNAESMKRSRAHPCDMTLGNGISIIRVSVIPPTPRIYTKRVYLSFMAILLAMRTPPIAIGLSCVGAPCDRGLERDDIWKKIIEIVTIFRKSSDT